MGHPKPTTKPLNPCQLHTVRAHLPYPDVDEGFKGGGLKRKASSSLGKRGKRDPFSTNPTDMGRSNPLEYSAAHLPTPTDWGGKSATKRCRS